MDVLNFKPKNVLPNELIDQLSEYWCDSDDTRTENLEQFIQRVAEIGQWWPHNQVVEELQDANKIEFVCNSGTSG